MGLGKFAPEPDRERKVKASSVRAALTSRRASQHHCMSHSGHLPSNAAAAKMAFLRRKVARPAAGLALRLDLSKPERSPSVIVATCWRAVGDAVHLVVLLARDRLAHPLRFRSVRFERSLTWPEISDPFAPHD